MYKFLLCFVVFFSSYTFAIMDGSIPADFCINYGDINIISLIVITLHIFLIYLTSVVLLNNYHLISKLCLTLVLLISSYIFYETYIRIDFKLLTLMMVIIPVYVIVLLELKKFYIPILSILSIILFFISVGVFPNHSSYGINSLTLTVVTFLTIICLSFLAKSKKIKNNPSIRIQTIICTAIILIFLTTMSIINLKYHKNKNDYSTLSCYQNHNYNNY